jgi:hypothetical protein
MTNNDVQRHGRTGGRRSLTTRCRLHRMNVLRDRDDVRIGQLECRHRRHTGRLTALLDNRDDQFAMEIGEREL